LVAADSVTNAMSSLVKELNSEASSGSEAEDEDETNGYGKTTGNGIDGGMDDLAAWREEMQQRLRQESEFIAQLRARRSSSRQSSSDTEQDHYIPSYVGESYSRSDDDLLVDEAESYIRTDDESYIKTDEEDAELYDRDPKELLQHRYLTDDESCLETDQESYIRTDDEEGGNTEWEDAMRRWVNR